MMIRKITVINEKEFNFIRICGSDGAELNETLKIKRAKKFVTQMLMTRRSCTIEEKSK